MEQWIKDFVEKLQLEGKSDKTIKQYSISMKDYFKEVLHYKNKEEFFDS